MKKVLLVLLAMAAPLFASVTFTFTDNGDGTGTLSYTATAGDEPVGMGLVVTSTAGQIDAIASISSFFDIFLDFAYDDGSYTYGEGKTNPNNAAAKISGPGVETLPSAGFVVSIGGLGGATAPLAPAPSSGSIVLQASAATAGTISADTLRGGVVDKAGAVSTNLPIAFVITSVCLGDMDMTADVTFDDLLVLLDLLEANGYYLDPSSPDWNAAGDMDSSGDLTFDDLLALLDLLEGNGYYIACPY